MKRVLLCCSWPAAKNAVSGHSSKCSGQTVNYLVSNWSRMERYVEAGLYQATKNL